jgi:hypothetical protein
MVVWARAIVAVIGDNPSMYPKPVPPLAQVTAHIDAFDDALVASHTRAVGSVAERQAVGVTLIADFDALRQFVQSLADADTENASAIITTAGMTVRKARSKGKAPLVARPSSNSSYVDLIAKAVKNAAHEWGHSTDGGTTWISEPTSLQSKVRVGPLPLGVLVKFRHRVVTKIGPGDWDDPVSLIVV